MILRSCISAPSGTRTACDIARLKAVYRNGDAHAAKIVWSLCRVMKRSASGIWNVFEMIRIVNSSMTGTTIALTVNIAFIPLRSSKKQAAIVISKPDW
ncbi:hypothetical protein D3C78_1728530 [compost metagenome]